MPEARIPLAHATVYMCRAKKNREAYESLGAASEEIEKEKTRRVPEELKNKHFPGQSVVDAPLCEVRVLRGPRRVSRFAKRRVYNRQSIVSRRSTASNQTRITCQRRKLRAAQ